MSRARRLGWFALLWAAGVVALGLAALVLRGALSLAR
ncbi:MAG: DUF2474 family protein [Rhizobiales bacterium]|nr:DUF2474 family protein [Hyphomicrobiales bacterium]